MLRDWGESTLTILREEIETARDLVAAVAAGALVVGLFAVILPSDQRTVFNALVLAQASVLAIVFSVTILGVQLVANRYSPGMTSLITGDRIFTLTFWLLVGSAAFDLFAILFLPALPAVIRLVVVAGAVFLAAFAVAMLWRFVNTVLERSTPEGLLDAYAADMTADAYWEGYLEAKDDETVRHPFHELFEMTMAALTNNEWLTARKGLDTMDTLSEKVITELADAGSLGRVPGDDRYLFDEPLKDFLPRIAVHAAEEDEREIAHTAIEVQQGVGQTGIDNDRTWLARAASQGLRSTIQESPSGMTGSSLRSRSFRGMGELLEGSLRYPNPRIGGSILLTYSNALEDTLGRSYPAVSYNDFVDRYFRDHLPAAFDALLEWYSEFLATVPVDWAEGYPAREMEKKEPVAVAFQLQRSLFSVTVSVLQFEAREEEFPGTRSQMIEGWRNCCAIVGDSGVEPFAKVLMEDFIELAYWQTNGEKEGMAMFARAVAKLLDNGNEKMVAAGLQGMREKDSPGTMFDPWRPRRQESSGSSWVRRFGLRREGSDGFEAWLGEFQDEVFEYADSVDMDP